MTVYLHQNSEVLINTLLSTGGGLCTDAKLSLQDTNFSFYTWDDRKSDSRYKQNPPLLSNKKNKKKRKKIFMAV